MVKNAAIETIAKLNSNVSSDNQDHEDLLKLDQGQDKAFNEADAAVKAEELMEEVKEPKELDFDQLGQIICQANELCDFIQEIDPITERQSRVQTGIENLMACYKIEQKQQNAN